MRQRIENIVDSAFVKNKFYFSNCDESAANIG